MLLLPPKRAEEFRARVCESRSWGRQGRAVDVAGCWFGQVAVWATVEWMWPEDLTQLQSRVAVCFRSPKVPLHHDFVRTCVRQIWRTALLDRGKRGPKLSARRRPRCVGIR